MSTAEFYRLSQEAAGQLLDTLRSVIREWKSRAKAARLPASEISAVGAAFSQVA